MPVMANHQPGYYYGLYRRHSDTLRQQPGRVGRSSSSGVITMMEHSGTHVDALCHQAEDLKFYGCGSVEEHEGPAGFSKGDASEIPVFNHRGIMLDIGAEFGGEVPAGELITEEQLRARAQRQAVEVSPGTVVLVRTGNGRHWNDSPRYLDGPGLAPDASTFLAKAGVAAVGADNMAWDLPGYVDAKINCDLPGHLILMVHHGVHIFENLNLEELSARRVYEFDFFATPLKFSGATGSPIRPIAFTRE